MKFRRIETDYVAIGLIAFCLVCIGLNELFNPTNVISRAFDKSYSEYSQRETANSPWLNEDLDNTLKSGDMSLDIAFTNTGDKKGGLTFTLDRNDSNRKAQAQLGLTYDGTSVLTIDAFVDDMNTVLKAPVLYEQNISLDTDTFSRNVYALSNIQCDDTEKQNIFFDPSIDNYSYTYTYNNLKKAFSKATRKALQACRNNIEVSSLDKTDVNNVSCKGYQITVDSEGSDKFLAAFGENLFSDTNLKSGVNAYVSNDYNSNAMLYQMYYGVTSSEELADMLISGYQNMYNSLLENTEPSDTTVDLYLNSGRLISMKTTGQISAQSGTPLNIVAAVDYDGANKPTDNLKASLSFDSEGNTERLEFSDINTEESNKLTTSKAFSFYTTTNYSTLSANTTYDKESNEFTIDAGMEQDDQELLGVEAAGTFTGEKGYINADFTSVSLKGTTPMSGEGHIYVTPLSNEITPIEGDAVDITTADDDTVSEIMSTIQNNLTEILTKMGV